MKTWKLQNIIAISACFLWLASGCKRSEQGSENVHQDSKSARQPFGIGMVTFAGYAPLYLAKEKGFFDPLDVQLKRIEEIPNLRAGMESKTLEAYLATTDIALDTDKRPDGVSIWAIDESAGGDGVVVSADIKDLSDLKGKTIAAEPGLPPYFVLSYLLHKSGFSLKDVNLKDMKTQDASTAFVSGSVAAAGLYEPYLSTAQSKRPGSRIVVSTAQTPGLVVDQIFVRADVLSKREDDVQILINGWRKALAFIQEKPDEANAIMAKEFNLPVNEFKDIASAVKWLDLKENKVLYGNAQTPGVLATNYALVKGVLQRNRPSVFDTKPGEILSSSLVESTAK